MTAPYQPAPEADGETVLAQTLRIELGEDLEMTVALGGVAVTGRLTRDMAKALAHHLNTIANAPVRRRPTLADVPESLIAPNPRNGKR